MARFFCHTVSFLIFLEFVSQLPLSGASPKWDFDLPHIGRVLYEGGWYQEYNLGVINASPEFNFPLQLVYLSTRETAGSSLDGSLILEAGNFSFIEVTQTDYFTITWTE